MHFAPLMAGSQELEGSMSLLVQSLQGMLLRNPTKKEAVKLPLKP